MNLPPFKLEEFWKKYEFEARYILSASDAESLSLNELLEFADSDSLKLWEALTLGYTQSPGHPKLREEIAKLYSNLNLDQILTLAGAEEGIYSTMRVLIEPNDHVIVIEPLYQSLRDLPRAFGAEVTSIQLKAENQWKLDVREVERAFRPSTKLLVLNNPHNPTGMVLEKTTLKKLIDLSRKNNSYIFCDEVYRYLEVDESLRTPAIAEEYERGISLNVMTKSFGLAGLRIGWIATQNSALLSKISSYKLYTSICNSAPSEVLAIIALRAKERILKRNRDIVLENLKVLDEFMERNQKYVSWIRPQSGTIALLKLLLPISVDVFAEDLVHREGVLIMPGSIFDLPGNFFRIGFGKRNMPEILKRFESYLSNYATSH